MKGKIKILVGIFATALLLLTACAPKGPQKTEKIANPMVRYDTLAQVEEKIGYKAAVLPAYTGFTLKDCYIIGDTLVDLRYQNSDGIEATVRTSKNATGDISGYQNISYHSENANGIVYNLAEYSEDHSLIATFTKGDMSYSMSAKGMNLENFKVDFITVIDSINQ